MNKEEFIKEFEYWTKEEILERTFDICSKNVDLQQENKLLKIQVSSREEVANKYKEVIDKAINNSQYWIDYYTKLNSDERIALRLQENIDILKEVDKEVS